MDFTNQRNTASDVRSRLSRHQHEHHEYAVAITKGGQLHCWAHTKSIISFLLLAHGTRHLFHSFCCTAWHIFEPLLVYEPGFNMDKYGMYYVYMYVCMWLLNSL